MASKTKDIIALIFMGLYLAFYVRKFFDPKYPVPSELLPIPLAAAGFFFADKVIKAGRKEEPK